MMSQKILVLTPRRFSPTRQLEKFMPAKTEEGNEGAIATFNGFVRNENHIKYLHIEAYLKMARLQLDEIANNVLKKFSIQRVLIIHRYGALKPTEPIVLVAVSAAHRKEAFAGCSFIIEALKTQIALWKCEIKSDGSRKWITPP